MMRGVPAVLFLIPFEHGEIHYPEELEFLGIEQLVAVVILLRGEQAQLAASLIDGLLGTMTLGLAGPGGQQQEIFLGRAGALADACHGWGMVAFHALGVVENAKAALCSESFQLVAFLTAEGACLRNVDGHQWEAVGGEFGEQVLHWVHRRQAAIWFIAAIAAHGFGVAEARERRLNGKARYLAN